MDDFTQLCDQAASNAYGTAHGGSILAFANTCGQKAVSMRYPEHVIFTDRLDRMDHIAPVFTGDTMTAKAEITQDDGCHTVVNVTVYTGRQEESSAAVSAEAVIRYRLEERND